jgi:methyl-accepting chemotaxis protein
MLKNVKLGTKLLLAFASVTVITLLVGLVGFYGATKSVGSIHEVGQVRLPAVDSLLAIAESAESVRGTLRTLAIAGQSTELRQRQYQNLADARERYGAAWKAYEELPRSSAEVELWKQFEVEWNAWRDENNKYVEMTKHVDSLGIADPMALGRQIEQFTKDHYLLVQRVLHLLHMKQSVFAGGDDHTACNAGKWLSSFKTDNETLSKELQSIAGPHRQFHDAVKKIKELVAEERLEEARDSYEHQMVPAMEEVFKHFDAMLNIANESIEVSRKAQEQLFGPVTQKQRAAIGLLKKIAQSNREAAAKTSDAATAQAGTTKAEAIAAMVVASMVSIVLGILLTRSITGPIRRVIAGLTDGSDQVASASTQVSSASQSLAEGASEQAAAIEETSSSLEEMASMTRQNAENAQQANGLMSEAKRIIDTANASMGQLTESMADISRASEETSKIIKTIDEIAFQTNLLALNAAVEAARAGEAGAGFAVVADEVRNLAMRAAEAAKSTADLIEGTVKKVKDGTELMARTNEAFQQVAGSSTKVAELVGEISAASSEQAQGIDQINRAVSEMDKVTQQNAANAEESAAASEEMNAQAESMKDMVGELVVMVGTAGGRREKAGRRSAEAPRPRAAETRPSPSVLPAAELPRKRRPNGKDRVSMLSSGGRERNPREVIPMDQDTFSDF